MTRVRPSKMDARPFNRGIRPGFAEDRFLPWTTWRNLMGRRWQLKASIGTIATSAEGTRYVENAHAHTYTRSSCALYFHRTRRKCRSKYYSKIFMTLGCTGSMTEITTVKKKLHCEKGYVRNKQIIFRWVLIRYLFILIWDIGYSILKISAEYLEKWARQIKIFQIKFIGFWGAKKTVTVFSRYSVGLFKIRYILYIKSNVYSRYTLKRLTNLDEILRTVAI